MSSRPDTLIPASAAADETLVGRRVDKYEISRVIGRGGMGMVYEALNTSIGKRVAMKFVDAELAHNKDSVARFQREAQAASAVESAHIVEIFDSGTSDDGLPYIVMELLRGEDLGHRIKRCGRLELGESLHLTAQILRGLHRAHEAGIVHRDLKPDNIFLVDRDDDPNFAKILDFGISKVQRPGAVPVHTLTREGTVLGTPFYMSPEQAQALGDLDGRTDLWSVGAILYECLTGRPPQTGQTYEQVIINICMKDAADVRTHNPAVPEPIARVIQKALTRERADRFQNAREMLDALATASGGLISSRPVRSSDSADSGGSSHPSGARTPHVVPASTPSRGDGTTGNEPTLEVQNPSRIGWSTSGRDAVAKRERRLFVGVAAAAMAAGAIGALVYIGVHRTTDVPAVDAAAPVELVLHANAKNARFLVNGAEVEGGRLRGRRGEVKKVRVEAEGFLPSELSVVLDPAQEPAPVTLASAPAPSASAMQVAPLETATATPSEPVDTKKPHNGKTAGTRPVPSGSTVASPVASQAAKQADPKPQSTGVAGELKLKTD
jgi:serine/threonine-protein kinase